MAAGPRKATAATAADVGIGIWNGTLDRQTPILATAMAEKAAEEDIDKHFMRMFVGYGGPARGRGGKGKKMSVTDGKLEDFKIGHMLCHLHTCSAHLTRVGAFYTCGAAYMATAGPPCKHAS